MSPPDPASTPNPALQRASPGTLRNYVDYWTNEYANALFKQQTGVFAVVEDANGIRRRVVLDSGFRSEGRLRGPKPDHVLDSARELVEQGPFEEIVNGEKITYVKTKDGIRIDYKQTSLRGAEPKVTITRVIAADGTTPIPHDAQLHPDTFGDIKIGPNEHHAEIRLKNWAERSGYKIIAMSPSRGCCPHCEARMREYFKANSQEFEKIVPETKQTRGKWLEFRRELRKLGLKDRPNALPPRPGAGTEFVSKQDLSALIAESKEEFKVLKTPNLKLERIGRFLKIAGPAMLAFDAATTYAKAADQWRTGAKSAAAETFAEFGGRTAGALLGAEAFGLLFGGLGSTIPVLGTTVGGLAGMVIGGAVGAWVGEQKAKEMCHQVIGWAKEHGLGSILGGHDAKPPPNKMPPQPLPPPTPFGDPAVDELQQQMLQAGYDRSAVNFVCGTVYVRTKNKSGSGPKTPKQVFEQLGSQLPDVGSTASSAASARQYPWASEDVHGRVLTKTEAGQISGNASQSDPQLPGPVPTGATAPGPGTWPGPSVPASPAPLLDEHQDDPDTRPPLETPRFNPDHGVAENDEPQTAAGRPVSPSSGVNDDLEEALLSSRIETLRKRTGDYDGRGQTDALSSGALEADLNELRRIQDQMTLSGSFQPHLANQITEVRNRLEQAAETARRDDDQKRDLTRQLANDERARQQEEALRAQREKQKGEEPRDRKSDRPAAPTDERTLQDLETRRREEAERDRRDDEKRKREDTERDQRERDERKHRDDERDRIANEDRERREQARRQQEIENRQRKQDTRKQQDAERQQREQDARKQQDAERQHREPDARKQQDAERQQRELDTRKQQDAERQQRELDTRKQQDAERQQRELDTRKQQDAERQQRELDTRKQQDAERQQRELDARKQQEAQRQQRELEARRQQEAQRQQRELEARKQQDAERQQRKIEARKQQEAQRQQRELEARRQQEAQRQQRELEARKQQEAQRQQRELEARKQQEAQLQQRELEARKQQDAERQQREIEARKQQEAQRQQRELEARRQQEAQLQQRELEARRQQEAQRQQRELEARRQQEAQRQQRELEARKQQEAERQRREWEAQQKRLAKEQQQREHELRQKVAEEARAKKEWERQREQQERERRRIENEVRQRQREDEKRRRDWEQQQKEAARRQKEWEWQRQQQERERRRIENEARQRQREEEHRRREWERQQKQAERERRDREREQRLRDRDQRRASYSVRGTIIGRNNNKRGW